MVTLLRQMQSCTDITLLTFLDSSNVDILQKAKTSFTNCNSCLLHSESDLPIVPSYNTPSSGLQTSGSSLVPQMTNFPTSSICSTATIVSPRPTKTTRTIVSTVVHVERHSTNSPRKSGDEDSSSPKMNSLSTLPIVVIAVSGIVTVGLGFSCYIWRRRNSARLLSFSVLKYIELFCIISKGHKKQFFFC